MIKNLSCLHLLASMDCPSKAELTVSPLPRQTAKGLDLSAVQSEKSDSVLLDLTVNYDSITVLLSR